MARPSSKRREIDTVVPLEGLRFEDVRLKGIETREELKARLVRESHEHLHRVWRNSILFGIVSGGVTIVALASLWIAVRPVGQSPDNQRWATTLLTTIVSAGVGYLTGKASKST
jgi:hypothetical protein